MARYLLPLAALAVAFFITAPPAPAGTVISDQCFPSEVLARTLASEYGERVVALGVASVGIFKGMLIERWESMGGKNWTLTATFPGDKFSCVVAGGDGWQKKRPSPIKPTGLAL